MNSFVVFWIAVAVAVLGLVGYGAYIKKFLVQRSQLKSGKLSIHTLLARSFFDLGWKATSRELASKTSFLATGLNKKKILSILTSEPQFYSRVRSYEPLETDVPFVFEERLRPIVAFYYHRDDLLELQKHITAEMVAAELSGES